MCVKCIVDSSHNNSAAKMLVSELEGWDRALDYLFDPKNKIELSDAENKAIIELSNDMCDWADVIYTWVKYGNDVLRPIAIAHSYPNKK